ncbi:TIGR03885 family FMN-dependent LLM class oxidoreductase [Arthrobacter sp. KK5.5]|uniref:TIGR03885 family FMN-dependent LLM class oxidoreductase n=1 Tax=Arthrobacter sp. KK5.5 TaxID=3373084 RepID=UPI003EE4F62D
MPTVGFHASHEQIGPAQLLEDVRLAEAAGFGAAMCSDHLHPWSEAQGHSGNAWAWLGAALASTGLRFGTVTAPGQRYHPAITAQAAATLAVMFPGRFWMATGTGENLNESVTGDPWPPKDVRQDRLEECVDVMRRLFAGGEVTHRGLVTVESARLWDVPATPPPMLVPAVSTATAARGAAWADGLITINQPVGKLRDILESYRGAGGTGPACLQVHLCWAPTEREAEGIAMDQWRANVVSPPVTWDLPTTAHFDSLATRTTPDDVRSGVLVSADLGEHAEKLAELAAVGFDEIYLHHVGTEQAPFIRAFGEHVLPRLKDTP